ncbi:cysteine hydrolase family protein [Actinotalea sp.]|uniref:cysteine hydrolase family protein n=1 Tax=Actinotalea sp. TaxID=1872145 RepID=UPI003569E6AD
MTTGSWLVAIDMQRIFGEPSSQWFTPRYAEASAGVARLRESFGERVAFTRFLAPSTPTGAWVPYYEQWPFALDRETLPLYDLMPEFALEVPPVGRAVLVDRTTFGKWDADMRASLAAVDEIVLTGVSTDCCVLSTALAAADDGVRVRVVADACAGVSDTDHQRALDALALYGPMIEITTVDEVLADRGGAS